MINNNWIKSSKQWEETRKTWRQTKRYNWPFFRKTVMTATNTQVNLKKKKHHSLTKNKKKQWINQMWGKTVTFWSYLHYWPIRGWDLGNNRARCWRWEGLLYNNTSIWGCKKYIWDLKGRRTDYSGCWQWGRLQRNLLKTPHETLARLQIHS